MPESARPFDREHIPAGAQPLGPSDPRELGGYHLLGRIGAGGMGAVYAGLDERDRCAAVKVIHPEFATNPDFLARFAREIDLVARVRARCTAAFYGADVQSETPWLATEYVPGLTLRQHVKEHGPLSGGMLLALAGGLAEALAAIHEAGIVHRDLKPGNIILAPDGPKVLDFGIARAAEETAITATGGLLGTPGWIAPEQYEGGEPTPAADMFAWGGLVAFAATGRNPFGTGTPDVLSYRTRNEPPDLDGLPEELTPLITQALAKEPDQRPTATEALELLTDRWNATRPLTQHGVEATQLLPVMLEAEWSGIHLPAPQRLARAARWPLLAAGVAIVLVMTLGGWGAGRMGTGAPLVPGLGGGGDNQTTDPTGEGGEDGEDGGEETGIADPTDPQATLEQAIELATTAESFEVLERTQGVDQPILGTTTATYRYTEDPEPIFHYQQTGEGGADTQRYGMGADFSDVVFKDHFEQPFYRDPNAAEEDLAEARPEYAAETLNTILETSQDITHEGSEELEAAFEDWSEQAGTPAERYSGTFTRPEAQFNQATGEFEDVPVETAFDLWIGTDGYPLRVHYEISTVEGTTEQQVLVETAYLLFNEEVRIDPPDESEIEPSPPPDLGP